MLRMKSILATQARIARNELNLSYASLHSKKLTQYQIRELVQHRMNSILVTQVCIAKNELNISCELAQQRMNSILAKGACIAKMNRELAENELNLNYASSHSKESTQSQLRKLAQQRMNSISLYLDKGSYFFIQIG